MVRTSKPAILILSLFLNLIGPHEVAVEKNIGTISRLKLQAQ